MIGNTWFARHSRCQAAVVRRLFAIFLRVRDTCLGYMVFIYKALETEVDCQRSESCVAPKSLTKATLFHVRQPLGETSLSRFTGAYCSYHNVSPERRSFPTLI